MWDSFQESITFHMLMVFRNDATKAQRYYISNCIKKPNQVPIRQFVQCMQQLIDYFKLLPCLYQSNQATKTTKKVWPIEEGQSCGPYSLYVSRDLAGPI